MTSSRAHIALLRDHRRLHLQDGPIDLIVEAFGPGSQVRAAYSAAANRFVTILDELCSQLPGLRQTACPGLRLTGPIAQRMLDAVLPYAPNVFITPMATVAGAVAEEILKAMTRSAQLTRAYVNNGGDIALHIEDGEEFRIGMVERPDLPSLFGRLKLSAKEPIRGIATSGWRGRSYSLGIADAVTVLAESAAAADAAATIIANTVDLPGHPAITRVPACELSPDSDLGARLVTRRVEPLSGKDIDLALDSGASTGGSLVRRSLICAAALRLQGQTRTLGRLPQIYLEASPSPGRLARA